MTESLYPKHASVPLDAKIPPPERLCLNCGAREVIFWVQCDACNRAGLPLLKRQP